MDRYRRVDNGGKIKSVSVSSAIQNLASSMTFQLSWITARALKKLGSRVATYVRGAMFSVRSNFTIVSVTG